MARLSPRGVSLATPFDDGRQPRALAESDLDTALAQLCPGVEFTHDELSRYFLQLELMIGSWLSEQNGLDSIRMARRLGKISDDLETIGTDLSGHEGGLRTAHEIELTSQLADILSLDPTLGSRETATGLINRFVRDAQQISHACRIAAVDLKQRKSPSGRPAMSWHDDFTRLLFEVAARSNTEPRLWRDRVDQTWKGWLFDAASRLELFLPKGMRSGSDEARGKRVARSRQRFET